MRAPFRWARSSLQVVCACCAIWGTPVAALAVGPAPAPAPVPSLANNGTARLSRFSFDRRVLTLLAMGCLVGMIAGWLSGGPREPRMRLLNKPKKMHLEVLVPPGPAPRLIPRDSPHATRASSSRIPVSRQAGTHSGVVDYIAAFAESEEGSEGDRIDYLL